MWCLDVAFAATRILNSEWLSYGTMVLNQLLSTGVVTGHRTGVKTTGDLVLDVLATVLAFSILLFQMGNTWALQT